MARPMFTGVPVHYTLVIDGGLVTVFFEYADGWAVARDERTGRWHTLRPADFAAAGWRVGADGTG